MAKKSIDKFTERISHLESGLFSLMIGMGETYFAALVLSLGLGEISASTIAIVPVVIGSIVHLFWPSVIVYFRSEKSWVIFCASVQTVVLAFLGAQCLFDRPKESVLLLITTIYWAAHFAAGPAWNTWLTSIVEKRRHYQFFVNRSRVHELSVLAGLLIAGIALQLNSSSQTFGVIFLFAALFRGASAISFIFHPANDNSNFTPPHSIWSTIAICLEKRKIVYLLLFTFFFQFAVQIAGPFFTPFMLVEQKFSYLQFATLISLPFIARTITYKYAAIIGSKFGIDKVWAVGIILIFPLPVLWLFFHEFWQLVFLQILGGVAWSCAEYGQTLALVQRFQPERRSSVLTISNLFASLGMGLGFIVGGLLWISSSPSESYDYILGTSSICRLAVCFGIPFVIFKNAKVQRLFMRWIGIRPGVGGLSKPILTEASEAELSKGNESETE